MLAKPKLQLVPSRSGRVKIARVVGTWKCLLECRNWSPTMFLFTNCNHDCILWQVGFGEAFTVKGGNFAEHIFVKCPKNEILFWWPKWHLTCIKDFNIEHILLLSIYIELRLEHGDLTLWAGLDLESRLKNGLGCKKSTPLIGREVGTRLFKFTPWLGAN